MTLSNNCENYIHYLSKTHGWVIADNKDSSATTTATAAASVETLTPENDIQHLQQKDPSHVPLCSDPLLCYSPNQIVPIPSDCIERMHKEGVAAHKILEDKIGCVRAWAGLKYLHDTIDKFFITKDGIKRQFFLWSHEM